MRPPKNIAREAIATLAALAAFAPSAEATVLHVTDGSGNCLTQSLGCSLATALGAAQPGDRIRVHAGVHSVSGTLTDSAADVRIEGAPNESRPVLAISGGGSGLVLSHGTGLSGVDVVSTGSVAVTALGGIVERVRLTAHGAGSVGLELGSGAVLRNSAISATGNNAYGVRVSAGGGLTQVRGSSILASGGGGAALIVAPSGQSVSSGVRAVNSVLRGYGGALDVRAVASSLETATVVLDHSATSPGQHLATGPGAAIDDSRSNLVAEPLFLDLGNMDLRQTAASPTIDAGTADLDGDGKVDAADVSAAGEFDLDGTPRQLGLPDIGSDEREMPPIVLAADPVVIDGGLVVRVVVQPRGLATTVTAEWTLDDETTTVGKTVQTSGNTPVSVDFPLTQVPAGSQISVRGRASNSAGTDTSADTTVAIPSEPVAAPTTVDVDPTATANTPPAPTSGALPVLVRTTVRPHFGIADLRLSCKADIECRGVVVLTRLGKATRWTQFRIPAGATRTVPITLTVAQTQKLRSAGKRGARALLEIRSNAKGSSFSAVRLIASKAETAKGTTKKSGSKS